MATYWENSCSFGLRYVSWYKYLIVSLVFSHLGFWSGNLFLIAPFPDLCLLVPFQYSTSLVSLNPKLLHLRKLVVHKMNMSKLNKQSMSNKNQQDKFCQRENRWPFNTYLRKLSKVHISYLMTFVTKEFENIHIS